MAEAGFSQVPIGLYLWACGLLTSNLEANSEHIEGPIYYYQKGSRDESTAGIAIGAGKDSQAYERFHYVYRRQVEPYLGKAVCQ